MIDLPTPFPMVTPYQFAQVEFKVSERVDLLAESFFQTVFSGPFEYCRPWDEVRKRHGCFKVGDAEQWAAGMNAIITVLNGLPRPCAREQLLNAYSL